MKKITLFVIFLMAFVTGNYAQVNGYNFSQNPGTYTPITGGAVLAAPAGDDVIYPVTLTAPFTFNTVAYSAVNVSSNGFITFGATAPTTTTYSPISATTGYAGVIAAFGRDLNSVGIGSEIRWEEIGNEIVFQWLNVRRYNVTGEQLNFQIRLNKTNSSVQIVYGTCIAGSNLSYPQVGMRGAANSDFSNRTILSTGGAWINSTAGIGNSSTMYFNSTTPGTAPASGLTYTWTLPSTATLFYYNLQWPPNGNITAGDVHNVYAQAYEPGVTNAPGQGAGIEVWIGYSTTNTNPNSPTGWTWFPATYDSDQEGGSNDQYIYNIANGRTPNTYYYASRFKYNGGPFTYGGIQANGSYGGTWGNDNNISGVLVVNPTANDLCAGAITVSCGNTYTGNTLYGTPESPDPGTCGTTAGTTGGAVWYKFIGANSSNAGAAIGSPGDTVTLDLSLSSFDTKIRVFSGVCGTLNCVGGDDDSGTGTTSLYSFASIVGTEYYVLVHGFNTAAGNYSLAMTCVPPPSCVPATFTLSQGANNCPGNEFYINVNLTAIGSASSLKITNNAGAPVITGATVAGSPYQVGPFPAATPVIITIEDEADNTCFVTSNTFTTSSCPASNVSCASARSIACGETINTTSVGSTGNQEGSGCTMGVNGIWFTFTGTGGDMTVASTAGFDHEVAITSGACGALVNVNCDDQSTGAETHTFASVLNQTYYVYVAHYASANTTTGNISITLTCAEIPTCVPATYTLSNGTNNCPGNDFYINVNITAIGTASSLKITNNGGAPMITGATVAGSPYQVGPFAAATDVIITIEDEADNTCFATSAYTTTVCPPPNDLLAGAIELTVGDTVCENQIVGTNLGATDSGELPAPTCASYSGGDLWYKVIVPSTGELTIETSAADANSITDTGMAVYSGTSGSLIELDCDDDGGTDLFSQVVLAGLNPGDVLQIRVWEYGNDLKGNFKICAWSPTSLGVTDSAFNGFSYYPNPVKDILTLNSQRNIENVTVFNIVGQRIINITDQATIQNVNMSALQSGTYIVKVMIDNQTKIIKVIKE